MKLHTTEHCGMHFRRTPHGVRGLKLFKAKRTDTKEWVAPHTGCVD